MALWELHIEGLRRVNDGIVVDGAGERRRAERPEPQAEGPGLGCSGGSSTCCELCAGENVPSGDRDMKPRGRAARGSTSGVCASSYAVTGTVETSGDARAGYRGSHCAVMTRRGALLLFLALPGDGLVYTHLGINGQLWEFAGGARVLVDPVLVGDLTFFGAPALYLSLIHI